jgi:superfamily II DNA/RNA helicase
MELALTLRFRSCRVQFDALQLAKPLHAQTLAAIKQLGFTNTTPVQQATIPLLLSNKDVAVQVGNIM